MHVPHAAAREIKGKGLKRLGLGTQQHSINGSTAGSSTITTTAAAANGKAVNGAAILEQTGVPQVYTGSYTGSYSSSEPVKVADKALQAQIDKEIRAAGVAPTGLWQKRLWVARRSFRIWSFLVRVVFKIFRLQRLEKKANAEQMSLARRKMARYMCQKCLKLGPTFSESSVSLLLLLLLVLYQWVT